MWRHSGRSAERSRTSLPSGRRTELRRRRKRVILPTRSWRSQCLADKANSRTTSLTAFNASWRLFLPTCSRLSWDFFFFTPQVLWRWTLTSFHATAATWPACPNWDPALSRTAAEPSPLETPQVGQGLSRTSLTVFHHPENCRKPKNWNVVALKNLKYD